MNENDHDALIRLGQQIKTLFAQQEEIKGLVSSVQEMAISIKELVVKVGNMDSRLQVIETEKRGRRSTIWACVATGVIGAAISYFMQIILR